MNTGPQQRSILLISILISIFFAQVSLLQASDIQELKALANQGDLDAQYNLGVIYYSGIGVSCDFQEALIWFRKAAEQGNVDGQVGIAAMLYKGEGTRQDFEEAATWLRRAADQATLKPNIIWELCTTTAMVCPRIIPRQYTGSGKRQAKVM